QSAKGMPDHVGYIPFQGVQVERQVFAKWRDRKSENALKTIAHIFCGHNWLILPARQNSFPVWIHVLPHFGLIVALAVGNFLVTLPSASELIVIKIDAQARLLRDANRAVAKRDASSRYHFILRGLRGIMRVT